MDATQASELVDAVTKVLDSLVLQLVDMNTTLAELHNRMASQSLYFHGIVDQLRTLNSAMSRLEDYYLSRP